MKLSRLTALIVLPLITTACRSEPPADGTDGLSGSAPAAFEGAKLSSRTLFVSPLLSAHATTILGSLPPHYHRSHEETVYLLSGNARLRVGAEWHDLKPGDLVHIPRRTVHEVVVDQPISVISLFAPPFDGQDRVFPENGDESTAAARETRTALGEGKAATRQAGFVFLPESPLDSGRGTNPDS